MKIGWFKCTVIGFLIFIPMACIQTADPNVPSKVTPSLSACTPIVFIPSQLGDSTPMFPDLPIPTASGPANLIEKAKEDLAQRLNVPVTQIRVVETVEVEWSDSSLGCPQPDMLYLQVITPGYRILLEANGIQYEYHSNRDAYVVFCENTNRPMLPKP